MPGYEDCSDKEILEGLKDEGVIKLDRTLVFRDGQRKTTGTFILTFESQTLPKYIRVGYYRVAVSQFISNPVKCYTCHAKFNCRKNKVCTKCGQEDHTNSQECKNEVKCVNCHGICLGSFRTSPIQSLYVELNEPPLYIRFDKLCVGEITRKCGFVNQKIRGRRPSNFLIHKFTLSSGFSGLNHKKRPCKNQCYIYVA